MAAGSDRADWTEAFAAFDRWEAMDDAERGAWADELAANLPALHARLQSLIRADVEAEGAAFLEPSADGSAQAAIAGLEGQQLGPWRIESLIGAGGMGQVWKAVRTDGRYEGHAAIKLMRLASADAGANARFAREGRYLGRLNHPNIARLLDAGTTAGGERYLVLEYVEGERIDRWCESHALDAEARLRLFVTVCEAVAHAHANLVVHRDLKPSNIFVAEGGEVKLLDFGVAKLLEGETGEVTELTREAGTALTPDYAAPEQLAGGTVSTATDVYGLGMVLRGLMPADALRGDLAVVVGKATKVEARERYATVPEFADDLRRILDKHPVKARPDSLAYRTRRYLQRHAFGVGAAALIVLAIASGFTATLVKQHEAERQAARAVAVKRFLLDLFEQARGSVQSEGTQAREATVNDLLAAGAKRVETELVGQPEIRDEVFQILIELYSDTGDPKQLAALAKRRLGDAHAAFGAEDVRSVPAEVTMAAVLINTGETPEVAKAWLAHAETLLDHAGDRTSLWRARELRWRGLLAM
ncbi:MAG: serine/threonine-protein kinase, partial [Caldimonas sp.]